MNKSIEEKILKNITIIFLVFLILNFQFLAKENTFLIKAGTIYTFSSKGVLKNASILVENGKIKKISSDQSFQGIEIYNFPENYVIPGIIDAHSYLSGYYRLLENTEVISPHLVTYISFDPKHSEVKKAIESGITTVNFVPRNENLIGGVSSIFKLSCSFNDINFIKKDAFLKISICNEAILNERAPTSLMGAIEMLNENLNNVKKMDNPTKNLNQNENVLKLLKKEINSIIYASTYEEIRSALKWMEEWKIKGIIAGGEEAHYFIKELKEKQIPVLLSPLLFSYPKRILDNAIKLISQGVKIGFVSNMPEGDGYLLLSSALLCYYGGISEIDALKTITINSAEILGISKNIGNLEEGKDADFVIFGGEPLNLSSEILAVFIDGKLVYEKEE